MRILSYTDEFGIPIRMVCSVLRRIAAISVAARVAAERGEVVGANTVGYSVRFDTKNPQRPYGSVGGGDICTHAQDYSCGRSSTARRERC